MNIKVNEIIDNYIEYGTLGDVDIEYLKQQGVINGLGGEGSYLKNIAFSLVELPYFDTAKSKKLIEDIEYRFAYRHDLSYFIGKSYIDFTLANIKFALGIFELTKWTKWYSRIGLTLSALLLTQTVGKRYFNWNGYESNK